MNLKFALIFAGVICCTLNLKAQCINSNLFPNFVINASNYSNDTTILTTAQWAGEYAQVSGMQEGATYRFIVSNGLFITISDLDDQVLSSGLSTVDYAPVDDTIKVHVNLTLPPCGSNTTGHTLSLYCVTCPVATTILMGPQVESDNSAIVNIEATQQGILIPRYSTSDKLSIPDPADGLLVYDTTVGTLSSYDSSSGEWQDFRTSASKTKVVVIPAESFHALGHLNAQPAVDYSTDNIFGRYGNFVTANSAAVFTAGLQIPVGSFISQIKYYYYDNNATQNVTFQIVRTGLNTTSESILNSFVSSGNFASKRNQTQIVSISVTEGFSFSIRAFGRTFNQPNYASIGIVGVEITYEEPQ